MTVQDDARIESDGRRTIATQTRTFPLYYEPTRGTTDATTQTTAESGRFNPVWYVDDLIAAVDESQVERIVRAAEDERLINQWLDRQRLENGAAENSNDNDVVDSSSDEEVEAGTRN